MSIGFLNFFKKIFLGFLYFSKKIFIFLLTFCKKCGKIFGSKGRLVKKDYLLANSLLFIFL